MPSWNADRCAVRSDRDILALLFDHESAALGLSADFCGHALSAVLRESGRLVDTEPVYGDDLR